ncbi:hypothetical protein [Bradyrhizobium glycinis]|uniref:hypothetical protein n=1 Tax=Bradyrhizobium glycinis TaxID=2751812 RepID=UPI0018D617A0|nr:hypothetical protein [Bradyrhizobium glycinis]MBH5373279.1 hypothetical protein [Bradyrhizobium glycinis]
MTQRLLGAARVFASNYQIVVCDDPFRPLDDGENWDAEKTKQGFAGAPAFRMIGTEADLNDHWVELVSSDRPPSPEEWQRITCVHFRSGSGRIHVMSVMDSDPPISADIERGDYALYVAGQNLGVDQLSLGETAKLSHAQIAERKDIEWYRLFLVPGKPDFEGRVVDR